MKTQVRVLGIDDSPFKFKDDRATVVGALVRVPNYLESVMTTSVAVDGADANDKLVEMISRSRYRDQIKAIMLDGIALAGFNVVDIQRLREEIGIPVLTVTRDRPDLEKMKKALVDHFQDWERRYSMISGLELRPIATEHKPVYACAAGISWGEVVEIVGMTTVKGAIPEPIRMAHLIATAVVRGESYGRS